MKLLEQLRQAEQNKSGMFEIGEDAMCEAYSIIQAAEKLVRCKGRYHAEQNYRALAALFGVNTPDLSPLPDDEVNE